MWKVVLGFGILCTALMTLFQLAEYRMIRQEEHVEIIVAVLAIVFFVLGVVFREKLSFGPKQLAISEGDKYKEYGLSKRETEVIETLITGATNKEIGEQLFLSESTVKTHLSNIYQKLEVKNRVEAVNKVKGL